jgi:hypothetical protein
VQKTDVSKSDDSEIEKGPASGRVCPTCGTCSTCGAKKQEAAPVYVPIPYLPAQPLPYNPWPYTITYETGHISPITFCAGGNSDTYYNVPLTASF